MTTHDRNIGQDGLRTLATSRAVPVAGAVLLVLAGSILLAVSAHVQVPFWPVKLSMQTFVVVAIGLVFGARLGGATVLAYLAEGAVGLPVFQGGAGLAYMAGPTGGYLAGFLLAAVVAGHCADHGILRSRLATAGAVCLALGLIYLPGMIWIGVLFGMDKTVAFGLAPFLAAETIKALLLVFLGSGMGLLRGVLSAWVR